MGASDLGARFSGVTTEKRRGREGGIARREGGEFRQNKAQPGDEEFHHDRRRRRDRCSADGPREKGSISGGQTWSQERDDRKKVRYWVEAEASTVRRCSRRA